MQDKDGEDMQDKDGEDMQDDDTDHHMEDEDEEYIDGYASPIEKNNFGPICYNCQHPKL